MLLIFCIVLFRITTLHWHSAGEGNQVYRYMRSGGVEDCKIQDMADAFWVIMVTLTSVGYGGRYPQSSAGKGFAIIAAMFGLFAQAMPLTIIGNTFYNIHITQERKRQKVGCLLLLSVVVFECGLNGTPFLFLTPLLQLHGRFKLRTAVFKCTNKMTMFHHTSHEHGKNAESGYEKLHKSLRMLPEHHEVVDQYTAIERSDIHSIQTSEGMAKFSALHDQVTKLVSLYLHTSDAAEVMNKQEEIARQLVNSRAAEDLVDGTDRPTGERKKKLIISTFKHLSTRYIDGMSFSELNQRSPGPRGEKTEEQGEAGSLNRQSQMIRE